MQCYQAWVPQLCLELHPTLVAAAGYVGTLLQPLPPLPQDHLPPMSPHLPFPSAQQPTGLGATMPQQNPTLSVDTSKGPISKEDSPHRCWGLGLQRPLGRMEPMPNLQTESLPAF